MREKPIAITDTTIRDAHQSLWATRMKTEDMVPILEKMDKVGYHSLEAWGGATFDAPLRFLDENPWERLRTIKKYVRNTPLQMLLRGQNLVGYRHYSDDIVRRFVRACVKNGMDIFRNFDALNDTRNHQVAAEAIKEAGGHVQAAVCYTISPVHTLEHYVETAVKLAEMGADSICIKDMAALLSPYRTYNLVKRFKAELSIPVYLHCHYIGGMAPMNYLKAIEAGVDVIDTASAPLAFGNSQPAVEMMVASLKDTAYDSGLNLEQLYEIAEYWETVREKRGFKRGVTSLTHMKVFSHQVPGGMISNLVSQLAEQKSSERLPEVLEEIPKVRAEVGYPPLVTPLSQIVGTQAVINVLSGKRWGIIPDEMKAYVKGYYGKPPGPMSPEVEELILKGGERLTDRPGALLKETFAQYEKEIGDLARSEEDVLMYALFPQIAREYLERHRDGVEKTVFYTSRQINAVKGDDEMDIDQIKELIKAFEESSVGEISIEEGQMKINLKKNPLAPLAAPIMQVQEVGELTVKNEAKTEKSAHDYPDNWRAVNSPMVGTFYRSPTPEAEPFVKVGDEVSKGQTLCILEAMKLMNEITMEENGRIREVLIDNAKPVEYGQPMFLYETI